MRIKQIISQSRRDFRAIFECEHCGHEIEKNGYNDIFFHIQVIPAMKCPECGQSASEDYRPLTTKYPDDMDV